MKVEIILLARVQEQQRKAEMVEHGASINLPHLPLCCMSRGQLCMKVDDEAQSDSENPWKMF